MKYIDKLRINKAVKFCINKNIPHPHIEDFSVSGNRKNYPCCAKTFEFIKRINRHFKAGFTVQDLITIATIYYRNQYQNQDFQIYDI